MALQAPSSPFSIFAPKFPSPSRSRPSTEIRFSRWNNANAQKFVVPERTQKEIEDEIRRERRFQSASNIADDYDSATPSCQNLTPDFKSHGTPSSPSLPSIPGKKSKYSKAPPNSETEKNPRSRENPRNPSSSSHPAFRRRPIPSISKKAKAAGSIISVGDHGLSYRIPNAPFEFQYSYTETPKVKPLAMREPYLPFGPGTMMRPWTGRKPLPASKKKLPEFDSFQPPPPNKKGVKTVQAPGPYLPGCGPKYATTREEILGEPLTEEERKDLVRGSSKARRMLHMGRDGLTHNMLENIHAHWKRRRVCKIKCLGVCTVDMDNVSQQLEEKTGGKVIYSRGGMLYLFRGRNYNYKTRPKFPLMLWKPMTPVYPRLIKRVPEGLTPEEATEMRERGQKLPPICKLGKNGVYSNLVKNVREAFEECDLVRINCQGMNKSDYKKIGAKLKDLVPCVLISYQHEHILMWRGKDWKSSFPKVEDITNTAAESTTRDSGSAKVEDITNTAAESTTRDSGSANSPTSADCLVSHGTSDLAAGKSFDADEYPESQERVISTNVDVGLEETEDIFYLEKNNQQPDASNIGYSTLDASGSSLSSESTRSSDTEILFHNGLVASIDERRSDDPCPSLLVGQETSTPSGFAVVSQDDDPSPSLLPGLETISHNEFAAASEDGQRPKESSTSMLGNLKTAQEDGDCLNRPILATENSETQSSMGTSQTCTEGVLLLLRQAIEGGSALILDDDSLDANIVYERAVALAKTAPSGPVFRNRFRKVVVQKSEKKERRPEDWQLEEVGLFSEIKGSEKNSNGQRKDFKYEYQHVIPQGSLGIDELAKLLS